VRRNDALAYSRKVLVNLNIDRLRRRRMVEVGGDPAEHALDRVADRDDAHQATSDRDHVVRLLAGLTDWKRRVVVLRHYFDLSEADVAAELGITPGTVKSTLARALAKLRVSDDTVVADGVPLAGR
jgi:RNA polymerase sigma factor (sigma-70 family)